MSELQTLAMLGLIAVLGVLLGGMGFAISRSLRRQREQLQSPITEKSEEKITEKSEEKQEQPISLATALEKTQQGLWGRIKSLMSDSSHASHLDEIEEILYSSDLGPATVERVMDSVKNNLSRSEKSNPDLVREAIRSTFAESFKDAGVQEPNTESPFQFLQVEHKPAVWLIVGVNGVGKTTSIGKLAAHLAQSGKKVLVAAGDTFRAAAESQLKVWSQRAAVEIFSPENVKDPAAVAFEAVNKAKAQGYDVVLIDTAGRLHTQSNLMEELKKVKRVMQKAAEDFPHETLIVLDANSGQNALQQAREFHKAMGLTGVVLTKMDGTAKGGVAVSLANELKLPIRLIGVGEKLADLRVFSPKQFLDSILP
jgi:fused signal recognition particle receptor